MSGLKFLESEIEIASQIKKIFNYYILNVTFHLLMTMCRLCVARYRKH